MSEVKLPVDEFDKAMHDMYPSNSKVYKSKKEDEVRRLKQVATGAVTVKEKSDLKSKVLSLIFSDDIKDVKRYVIEDLIIPGVKRGIMDIIGRSFFGAGYRGNGGYTNYSTTSSGTRYSYGGSQTRNSTYTVPPGGSRNPSQLRPIFFVSRADAENVLAACVDQIGEYGEVSVLQYYDAAGAESSFVDSKWGWTNLSNATVRPGRDGYYIEFPSPIQLVR